MATLTSTGPHWHHRELRPSCLMIPNNEAHGLHTDRTFGTLVQPGSTIIAISFIILTQRAQELVGQPIFSRNIVNCHEYPRQTGRQLRQRNSLRLFIAQCPQAPFAPLPTKHINALKQLAEIFRTTPKTEKVQETVQRPSPKSSIPTDPGVMASMPQVVTHRYSTRAKQTVLPRVQREEHCAPAAPPLRLEKNAVPTGPPPQVQHPTLSTPMPQPGGTPSPPPTPNNAPILPRHPAIPTITQEEVAAHADEVNNVQMHMQTPSLFPGNIIQHFLQREFTETGMAHAALPKACTMALCQCGTRQRNE